METYIHDLDQTLLKKNAWTIIRMYLTNKREEVEPIHKVVGKGILIKIPVYTKQRETTGSLSSKQETESRENWLKNRFRDLVVYNPFLYKLFFRSIIRKRKLSERENEAIEAPAVAAAVMAEHKIDLLVMHYASGRDSAGIIEAANQRGIPYVFINHFSNDCLNSFSVREQTMKAAGIGGVSNAGVPLRLRKSYVNISDGIDISFYDDDMPDTSSKDNESPILLLPARVTPVKGQHDLIKACAALRKLGIKVRIALAGRSDSQKYIQELKELAVQLNVEQDILFLGELTPDQLKYWYKKSSIMVFPTYHNEGLGRVLIEAQAMEVPPISYIIGGTPGAILNGETGYLVKKGDIKNLILRLQELLNDDKKREQMGKAGKAFVIEHFSLQAMALRHEQFYLAAINKANRRS